MINSKNIISQLVRAINTYPTEINLKRDIYIENFDKMGGRKFDHTEDVATFNGFINTSDSSFSIVFKDGGKVERIGKIVLIVPFSDEFSIKIGDYFVANGIKYRVKYPNLQLNICYLAELEIIGE